MPDPINATTAAGRARRTELETPPAPRPRPRRSRLLLVGLPMFAVFAAFGAIVWLAYQHGADGPPVGEPPLVRSPPLALKLAPDDDGASAGEGGEVVDMLSDAPRGDQVERLLPPPEEPRAPVVAEPATEPPAQPGGAASGVAGLTPPAPQTPPAEVPTRPQVAATTPAPQPAATTPAAPRPTPSPAPQPATTTPAPQPRVPPPLEQQTAEVARPKPPASPPAPAPSIEEAEATLDALLAEVTELNERQSPAPQPPPGATARVEPVAPRPSPSDVRPAVAAPVAQPPPPAQASPFPRPGAEVTPIDRPSSPNSAPGTAAARPNIPPPVIETAPARTNVAALDGGYRIQLAAVREEADARRAWDLFLVDLGPVLSEVRPFIERAETANGVFYRVQVGPFASLQAAESLCDELKQRNASCFVIRR